MSLVARLRHTITIERGAEGTRDEYGIPIHAWSTLATVRGWVQPRTTRELAQATQGGVQRGDYLLFLMPTDIRADDRVVWRGDTYSVVSVENPAFKDHHLEVGLMRVTVL